jgi:hypothetical protein
MRTWSSGTRGLMRDRRIVGNGRARRNPGRAGRPAPSATRPSARQADERTASLYARRRPRHIDWLLAGPGKGYFVAIESGSTETL